MLKHFLQYLMFGLTMFAAAAPPVAGGGAGGGEGAGAGAGEGAGGGEGLDGFTEDFGGEADPGAEAGIDPNAEHVDDQGGEGDQHQQQPEVDKDTADFKGLVSKRLVALKKEAPELAGVFEKYPKVQAQIEAAFRRDMAYREVYGTVAEARQMREQFPNGMEDVQQLLTDVGEVEQLDRDFYGRDGDGRYAGHTKIINNMFNDDREAAVALFRTLPREWARLDPESYGEVMSAIVGATHARASLPEWLADLRQQAIDLKQDGLAKELGRMLQWAGGFVKRRAEPTEAERNIAAQRAELARSTAEQKKGDQQRFHANFVSESAKLQESIVRKHPSVAALLASKAVPEAKKADIIKKIREGIKTHLAGSRAFMNKLKPAHAKGDMKGTLDIQRVAWSAPWVLNKFVRQVMAQETPSLVRRPGPGGQRQPAAGGGQRQPVNRGGGQQQEKQRTAPYKENGQWFSKDGRRLTTSEILRGAVPDHLLNAK